VEWHRPFIEQRRAVHLPMLNASWLRLAKLMRRENPLHHILSGASRVLHGLPDAERPLQVVEESLTILLGERPVTVRLQGLYGKFE